MMDNQIRSAELLVKNALSDPEVLQRIQEDPHSALTALKEETVQQLPHLARPNDATTNRIWIVIVGSFTLVMLYTVWILGSGVSESTIETPVTKSDTILTVLMTVISFLTGLLSPSPVTYK
ncbi:hypothetical protein [Pseudomonas putida]|uniref:Uncharacterized protein n=1 Tax=Pseudomonas putida TaxID=303 RepID=A0A6I6XGX0_PSEPU|nr:hypothetical protein [Pseudomonas putida]QHG64929.2 hypothetical protein C2H86_11115 [Pseudomonas putida]